MNDFNKRPLTLTMACQKDDSEKSSTQDFKQNYAKNKDDIEPIQSNPVFRQLNKNGRAL